MFDINFAEIKDGIHTRNFVVNDAYFESLPDSLIKNGNFSIDLIINKNDKIILLDFDIKGIIRLVCDRSLEEFDYNLSTKSRLVIRMDTQVTDMDDDDLISVSPNARIVNVSQYVYEFICLAIPSKKLHPKYDKETENTGTENATFVYSTADNSHSNTSDIIDNTHTNSENQYITADWEKLKKMVNNN